MFFVTALATVLLGPVELTEAAQRYCQQAEQDQRRQIEGAEAGLERAKKNRNYRSTVTGSGKRTSARRHRAEAIANATRRLRELKEEKCPVPLLALEEIAEGKIGRVVMRFARERDPLPSFRVVQVIDNQTMLAEHGKKVYLLSGVSTKGIVDDDKFSLGSAIFEAPGTHTYKTVLGGTSTVWVLRAFDKAAIEEAISAQKHNDESPGTKRTSKPDVESDNRE